MRKIRVLISTAFILLSGLGTPAFAGGGISFHISGGHHFFPGAAFSFHRHRSRAHLFLHLGHFGHRWRADPGGYYGPPPALVAPYPDVPQESFSGTHPSGALYVQGYRVLPSGWLRIEVEPADAEALVDGFPVKIDPVSGMSASIGFPVGKHQVEVRKEGFQDYRSEVEIAQARESSLRITLDKLD